jgi:hypothetical protein
VVHQEKSKVVNYIAVKWKDTCQWDEKDITCGGRDGTNVENARAELARIGWSIINFQVLQMQATNVLLLTGFFKKKSQITRVKKILKITPVSKTTCENYGLFFVFVFLNSFFFNFFF